MKSPLKRLLAYTLVDTAAFVANMAFFWLVIAYTSVHYLVPTVVGFWLQITIAFYLNRTWTFRSRVATRRGYPITSLVNIFALAVAVAGTALGIEVLGWSSLSARVAAGIAAGVVAFVLDSEFTFGKNPFK